MSRAAIALVALTTSVLICGCSTGSVPGTSPSAVGEPFFEVLISRATAAGADEEQLAVLTEGAANGGVSYEDTQAQLQRYFACLEPLGFVVTYSEDEVVAEDYRIPSYAIQSPPGSDEDPYANPAAVSCLTATADFVLEARATQPEARNAKDAFFATVRPRMEQCLVDNGYPMDPEWSNDELVEGALVALKDDVRCIWYTY